MCRLKTSKLYLHFKANSLEIHLSFTYLTSPEVQGSAFPQQELMPFHVAWAFRILPSSNPFSAEEKQQHLFHIAFFLAYFIFIAPKINKDKNSFIGTWEWPVFYQITEANCVPLPGTQGTWNPSAFLSFLQIKNSQQWTLLPSISSLFPHLNTKYK